MISSVALLGAQRAPHPLGKAALQGGKRKIGQIVFAGEVHPNERGYRLMAYKALEVFTRL